MKGLGSYAEVTTEWTLADVYESHLVMSALSDAENARDKALQNKRKRR